MNIAHWLLLAGIFLSSVCNAQELSKSFVEFSAGAGIPVGDFASKASNIKSGLAMNGLGINLEYGNYFKSKLGICVGIKNNVFPLDIHAWTKNPNASSDPWKVLSFYAGLTKRKQIREKIILSVKAAMGLTSSRYPDATILYYGNPNPIVLTFSSSTGNSAAFIGGVNFKYMLSQQVHLGLNADYFSASPKFLVKETLYNGQSYSSSTMHYTQNMQAITVAVGLCYNFGSRN